MKKFVLLTAIIGVLFSYTQSFCFAEGNLLKNPSFEQAVGTNPDGWETWMYVSQGATMTVENGQGHTGSKFVSITNNAENDARFKQAIPVKANSIYKLSCWAKTENVGKDKTGAIISIDGFVDSSKDLKGTNSDWQYLEMYAKIGNGISSIGVTVGLGGYGNMNKGKAYFDDISVEEVSKAPDGATVAQIEKLQPASDQSAGGSDSGSNSFVIVLLIAAVAIIGGIAYFIFTARKSKEDKDYGYDKAEEEEYEDNGQDDQDDEYLDDN